MDAFKSNSLEDSKSNIFLLKDSYCERLLVLLGSQNEIIDFRKGLKYLRSDISNSIIAVKEYSFLESKGLAILVDLEYTLIKLYKWAIMLIQANSFNLSVDLINRVSSQIETNMSLTNSKIKPIKTHVLTKKKHLGKFIKPKASVVYSKNFSSKHQSQSVVPASKSKKYTFSDLYGLFSSFSHTSNYRSNPFALIETNKQSDNELRTFFNEVVRSQPLSQLHNLNGVQNSKVVTRLRALSYQNSDSTNKDITKCSNNYNRLLTKSILNSEEKL